MATQKALVLESKDKLPSLQNVPRPEATTGIAVVQILGASLPTMAKGIFTEEIPFPRIYPLIPGSTAIGRIHALGPDATTITKGQLVFVDIFIRARDNPNASILVGWIGGYDPYSTKLMEGEWRNGTLAEYTKVPLENVYPLNEDLLMGKMKYSIADLNWLGSVTVPSAAIFEIGVAAGESVIVAPATGFFSGAAVHMALAMGARVTAAARNGKVLSRMAETFASTGRLTTVQLSGDVEKDCAALKAASGSNNGADAFIDFSPPSAPKSTHLQSAILALRPFGRCAMMGGVYENVEVPYGAIMNKSLRLQGRYMFTREMAQRVITLLESGLLRFGPGENSGIQAKTFKFSQLEEALDMPGASGWGILRVMEP